MRRLTSRLVTLFRRAARGRAAVRVRLAAAAALTGSARRLPDPDRRGSMERGGLRVQRLHHGSLHQLRKVLVSICFVYAGRTSLQVHITKF